MRIISGWTINFVNGTEETGEHPGESTLMVKISDHQLFIAQAPKMKGEKWKELRKIPLDQIENFGLHTVEAGA